MTLVPSPRRCIRMAVVILGLWALPLVEGETTLYQCTDASGTTVLTDSPAQLTNCVGLDSTTFAPKADVPQNIVPNARKQSPPHVPDQPAFPEPRYDPATAPFEHEQPLDVLPQEESAPATLHLTKIDDSMLVQVFLNRRQYVHLLVDTGASMTVLSYDLAVELGLLSGAEVRMETINTAGGSVQVTMTHVKEIRAGSAIARDVPVAVHDLPNLIPGVSGLLGMSFLNNFKVTLDAERGLLHLDPR